MRRRSMALAVPALLAAGLSACVSTITPATNTVPVEAVDFTTVADMKRGESCASVYLFFIGPIGDASVVKAAQAAGIRTVEVIDYEFDWNPFVQKYCVVAYGR